MDDSLLDDLENRVSDFEGLRAFVMRFSLRTASVLAEDYYLSRLKGRVADAMTTQERAEAHEVALKATEEAMERFSEAYGDQAWKFIWGAISDALELAFYKSGLSTPPRS